MERYASGEPFPEHLLRKLRWDFAGRGVYTDPVAFVDAVRRSMLESGAEGRRETWQPDEIVLRWPRILVGYELTPAGEDEDEDQLVDLAADGDAFTACELMFKLHNAVVEYLRDREQHRFEGLTFFMTTEEGDPMYLLRQGWSEE